MKKIKSQIVPINRKDIDTDSIIPAEYLKVTSRDGLGEYLFAGLCENDPGFPLNKPKYKGTQILVARENFGCGSSREHAVWALMDYGFGCVIAPSFGDIFYNNSLKNGFLPVQLDEKVVDKIFRSEAENDIYEIEVDLPSQRVILPDETVCEFEIDSYRKQCLKNEISDLDYLIQNMDDICRFDDKQAGYILFNTKKI